MAIHQTCLNTLNFGGIFRLKVRVYWFCFPGFCWLFLSHIYQHCTWIFCFDHADNSVHPTFPNSLLSALLVKTHRVAPLPTQQNTFPRKKPIWHSTFLTANERGSIDSVNNISWRDRVEFFFFLSFTCKSQRLWLPAWTSLSYCTACVDWGLGPRVSWNLFSYEPAKFLFCSDFKCNFYLITLLWALFNSVTLLAPECTVELNTVSSSQDCCSGNRVRNAFELWQLDWSCISSFLRQRL